MSNKEISRGLLGIDFIMVNKKIMCVLENSDAALYLAVLMSKEIYFEKHGMLIDGEWFFNTQENMFEDTFFSHHIQSDCLKKLKDAKLISVVKRGTPAKNHFKINHDIIINMIQKPLEELTKDKGLSFQMERQVIPRIDDKSSHVSTTINKTNNKTKEENQKPKGVSIDTPDQLFSNIIPRNSFLLRKNNTKISLLPKTIKTDLHSSSVTNKLDYWASKNLFTNSPECAPKGYKNDCDIILKLLNGTAFNNVLEYKDYAGRKFSAKEIVTTINRFALLAFSPEHEPFGKGYKETLQKFSLFKFVYNKYGASKNGYGSSFFIYCLNNEPKRINVVKDIYPILTESLINEYKKQVLENMSATFTNEELNSFKKAAAYWQEYFNQNNDRMYGEYRNIPIYKLAETLIEVLLRYAEGKRIKPHWLLTPAMKDQVPAWLFDMAIMQEEDRGAGGVVEERVQMII